MQESRRVLRGLVCREPVEAPFTGRVALRQLGATGVYGDDPRSVSGGTHRVVVSLEPPLGHGQVGILLRGRRTGPFDLFQRRERVVLAGTAIQFLLGLAVSSIVTSAGRRQARSAGLRCSINNIGLGCIRRVVQEILKLAQLLLEEFLVWIVEIDGPVPRLAEAREIASSFADSWDGLLKAAQ